MKKIIKIIRNLELVDKELSSAYSGVISISSKDGFLQFATIFVYLDKNVFVFIDDKELLKNLKFESPAKFTVILNKQSTTSVDNNSQVYNLFSITISGDLREVEEKKIQNTVTQTFIQKYSGKLILSNEEHKLLGKLVFVDSEELLAFDEVGF
jgi:hypothetical protein